MNIKTIKFPPWRPDQPALSQYAPELLNAIPQAQSYRYVPSLNTETNALDNPALRGLTAVDSSGTINVFAGDSTKLYKLSSNTFNNVSKVGNYTVDSWEMTKFGDRVIAVSLEAPTQFYDMGVSTLFADLAGSPPQADHIAVVRDFVVLGNLDIGGTQYPNRVQWSGFNNSEIWGSDIGNQSDFQDLFGNGGKIQRIVPGEYGVIFQESSIWRMDYSGPPTIFTFSEVERGRGTPAANSVTWLGALVYYWAGDGFYVFNGQSSTPIGAEKVDRYVKGRIDTSRYDEMYGGVDRRNGLIWWTYPKTEGGKEVVIYNWVTGEWGNTNQEIQIFTEFADTGYTLDQLDAVLGDIDSGSIPVDSPEYQGGAVRFGAFNNANVLCGLTGDSLEAEMVTSEMSGPGGQRLFVQAVRPIVEGSCTQSIKLGKRNEQCGDLNYTDGRTVNSIGEAQFHDNSRYVRIKAVVSGEFTHAHGVEVFFKPAGRV